MRTLRCGWLFLPETVTISAKMTTILAQDDSILAWFGGEEKKPGADARLLLISLLLLVYRIGGNYYANYFFVGSR
jgi:hypothetical protein